MKWDVIVIGGGIIGLSAALNALWRKSNLRLLILEKEKQLALHQTGNNSGVIHSGIYYKPRSLKAVNCRQGYDSLINFCLKEEIPFELCGKIIVATKKYQLPILEDIYKRGQENGLQGLKKLTAAELLEHEPHIAGIAGIHVPQTGIIDYKLVSLKFAKKIKELGGEIITGERVKNIYQKSEQNVLITDNTTFECKFVINCAGLYSDKVANFTNPNIDLKIIPFRGEYYKLKKDKEYLVKNLIYPVPDLNFPFLGVHFTRMIKGGVEAGPNAVLAFRREGYKNIDFHCKELAETLTWPGFYRMAIKYWNMGLGEMYKSFSKTAFTLALQELIPEIRQEHLEYGGAGVRAQACDRQGRLLDDFRITYNRGVVNVCNAPSPAATSSLAIGKTIVNYISKDFQL